MSMRHSRPPPRSIRVLTAGTFILLTLLVGGAIGLMAYLQQRDQLLAAVAAGNPEGRSLVADIGGKRWLTLRRAFELTPGQHAQTVVAVPWEAIFAGAYRPLGWTLLISLGLAVPAIWFVASHLTRSLARLADTAAAIRHFRLEGDPIPPSPVREVDSLGKTLDRLRASLRHFLEISQRLAAERRCDRLLERIVTETVGASQAQAGVVFLREADGTLRPMAWRHVDNPAPVAPESVDPALEPLFADALERGGPG